MEMTEKSKIDFRTPGQKAREKFHRDVIARYVELREIADGSVSNNAVITKVAVDYNCTSQCVYQILKRHNVIKVRRQS